MSDESATQQPIDREQIAALLYMTRYPNQIWMAATGEETAVAYEQADAILSLVSSLKAARIEQLETLLQAPTKEEIALYARIKQLEAALREIKDQYLAPDQSSAIAKQALDQSCPPKATT